MERIDSAYAEELHQNSLKPYSQSVISTGDKVLWKIATLNQKAYEQIVNPLLSADFDSVTLKHGDTKLGILNKSLSVGGYQKIIDTYYLGECPKTVKVQFTSPASFKQNGRYVFYPDLRLLYNSLMNKFDAFAENETIRTEEVLDQLTESSEVIHYYLRSTAFHLEGVKIPAFKGSIVLRINGPQPMVNLAHLLFHFGSYSGVGIKSAMGMGAMEVVEREARHDR